MKLNITYWSKNGIACHTCKSDKIVLIFFKHHNIGSIIKAAQQGKIKLVSSEKESEELAWLCKNCYDVGQVSVNY